LVGVPRLPNGRLTESAALLELLHGEGRRLLRGEAAAACVEINQCVGCSTPSSRRRVDGVEDDAMIQHERALKF